MKLLFDESLSPKLVVLLRDLFPESESALRNGLARAGDRRILEYAAAHDFILVSTDSDFERLVRQFPGVKAVILRSCDYPTDVAASLSVGSCQAAKLPAPTARRSAKELPLFKPGRHRLTPVPGGLGARRRPGACPTFLSNNPNSSGSEPN
jgi:predicted nuclease of predicted toxin-antitoxin system